MSVKKGDIVQYMGRFGKVVTTGKNLVVAFFDNKTETIAANRVRIAYREQ